MGLLKAYKTGQRPGFPVAVAVLALACILLELGGNDVRMLLAWDRGQLASGQLWRLVTGHFVHLGWSHLWLNLAGLALITWLVGQAWDLGRWALIAACSIAAMDAGFWWLDPGLQWYVGLSGLLHGLLAGGLFAGVMKRDREAFVLAAVVVAKLAWEQVSGPLPGSAATAGGDVIVNAHLYGAAGGLLGAVLARRRVVPAAPI